MRQNRNAYRTILLAAWLALGVAPAWGATIAGKVAFQGKAPKPVPINFGAEKQCAAMHKDKMPVNEEIVINPDNTVKWALVYVKEGATGTFTPPADPVTIDQNGCVFAPHAIGALAGQKVVFRNSDPVLHNVRAECKVNKMFNIAQPIQGMETKKAFENPEIGIRLKCDVHFWMTGYVHVLTNPYFSVTGEDGTFTIKDVPAGTYTLELWHEKLGTQTQAVTIGEGESKEVKFTLQKS